jgi:flagellar biosynthetic protein FliQ
MTMDIINEIISKGLYLVLLLSSPVLAVSLVVGLIISIFQATTQINEQTLTFVPKIFAVFITLALVMPWMMTKLVDFTRELLTYYMSLF